MPDSRSVVWGVWSQEDYYGSRLLSLHATEKSAEADAERRNDEHWPERPKSHNWPFIVDRHEVQP